MLNLYSVILLRLVVLIILFTSGILPQTGKIVKITDGDTMEMVVGRDAYKIRLAHIDAPEKMQDFGTKAKQYLSDLCYNKTVTMTVTDIDKYGRNVAVITLADGTNVNKKMVEAGYAWWYQKYSNDSSYGKLEATARKAKRGLWADKNPTPPWEWRKPSQSQCQATTKKGTQCKRKAIQGSPYCAQHSK